MFKKYLATALAAVAAKSHAGFGGMGNVESEGGGDIGGPELILVILSLVIAYNVMKKTKIGYEVEMFCGPFWAMVVLTFASLLGVGFVARMILN